MGTTARIECVDKNELQALLTPTALSLLDEVAESFEPKKLLRHISSLRKRGYPLDTVSAVTAQMALRSRAIQKFGNFANRMLFSRESLEMATRLEISSHHATRFVSAGVSSILDAGCGIGGDSLAFAGAGLELEAVDSNEVIAALAAFNLQPFENAMVKHANVMEIDLSGSDALWFDPSRRDGVKRSRNHHHWEPPLSWILEQTSDRSSGVKLAPGTDRKIIPADREAQWVSFKGETLQMILWSGNAARDGVARSALVLKETGGTEIVGPNDSPDEPIGPLNDFLHEPDGAVIRARLIGDLARVHGATMIDSQIAYMTSPSPIKSALVQSFQVVDHCPYSTKNIRELVRGANLRTLEIKKRGIDLDPAKLRRTLPLDGEGEGTLILTRLDGVKTAILARRAN